MSSRLGSLLAVLPLRVWTVGHLWNNLAAFQGEEPWQTAVTQYSHPLAQFTTAVVVLLPLVLRAIWGIGRLFSARPEQRTVRLLREPQICGSTSQRDWIAPVPRSPPLAGAPASPLRRRTRRDVRQPLARDALQRADSLSLPSWDPRAGVPSCQWPSIVRDGVGARLESTRVEEAGSGGCPPLRSPSRDGVGRDLRPVSRWRVALPHVCG